MLQIVLKTNNKNLDTDKRYVNVVHLPGDVDPSSLPTEVRKYLINVDTSDAGAYNGTVTPGWQTEADGSQKYLKPDGTYVTGWLTLDEDQYYMDENGVMLKDTITPDGHYVTAEREARILYAGLVPGQRRLALYPRRTATIWQIPGIRIQTENTIISIWLL